MLELCRLSNWNEFSFWVRLAKSTPVFLAVARSSDQYSARTSRMKHAARVENDI